MKYHLWSCHFTTVLELVWHYVLIEYEDEGQFGPYAIQSAYVTSFGYPASLVKQHSVPTSHQVTCLAGINYIINGHDFVGYNNVNNNHSAEDWKPFPSHNSTKFPLSNSSALYWNPNPPHRSTLHEICHHTARRSTETQAITHPKTMERQIGL